MPIKSTFAVEIGEGVDRFKEFDKLFEKYRDRLSKTPSAWGAVSKSNKEAEEAFRGMTAALLAQSEILKTNNKEQEKVAGFSNRIAGYWRQASTYSRSFFNNLVSVAKHDAIYGLLGLGGTLWGLDRLGAAAGGGLRASTGLGLPYGQMSAFGLTYNRVINAGGLLSAVSQAKGNIGGPEASALMALGINPSGGTGDLSKRTLRRIYEMSKQTPEGLLGPMLLEGYGLGNLGLSIEDLRRLRGMNANEFNKYEGQFGTRSAQLGVNEDTLRKWQNFVNTLDTTGKRIESSLIRGLVDAAGPLEKLSNAAADIFDKFVSGQGFKNLIEVVRLGLETFAKYLGSDKFKQDMRDLAAGFAALSEWILKFARYIGTSPYSSEEHKNDRARGYEKNNKIFKWFSDQWNALTVKRLPDGTRIEDVMPQGYTPSSNTAGSVSSVADLLNQVEKLELSGDSSISPAGAIGKYQIMPGTAKGYGVDRSELFDPVVNKDVATRILTDLSKRYQTTAEVLAAYNAGPKIADYLKAHGDKSLPMKRPDTGGDWDYHQTQEYLRRAGIRVTIDNPAGASVSTQADSLGGSYPGVVP